MSNTILLADDSLTIQKVVELTFADTEYEVVTTSSGDELLEKLPSIQPDVVICDVIMPGTDGYSVCQTIKSDASTLHIPVILLTGTFEPFDKERALAAGCDEIITKPFEARNLVAAVEKLLSGESGAVTPPAPPSEFEGTVRTVPTEPAAEGTVQPASAPPATEEPAATSFTEPFEPAEPAPAAPTEAAEAPPFEPPSPEIPEEGMDFTTTGFAEMEAAGQQPRTNYEQVPDEGLEFKIEDVEAHEEIDATIPEREAEPDVFAAEPPAMGTFEPEQATGDAFATPEEEHPFGEPEPESAPPVEEQPAVTAPIPVPQAAEAPPEETPATEEAATPPSPGLDSEAADLFTTEPESERLDDASTQLFAQPPVAPPPAPEPEAPGEPAELRPAEEEEAPQPEPEPEPAVEPAPAPTRSAPAPGAALSDEDIERIARRVVDLASDKLERIAWDVIPDVAELVVRQRIREIEAEVEKKGEA